MKGCSHKERKYKLTARELLINCVHCKETIHRRKRVLSSGIYAIGVIEKKRRKKVDVEVQFIGVAGGYGKTVVYYGVPRKLWNGLCDAKSKGSYHAELLKNKFPFDYVR